MKIFKQIEWFHQNSESYMSGYSRFYYWTHYPKALIKFLWSMRNEN